MQIQSSNLFLDLVCVAGGLVGAREVKICKQQSVASPLTNFNFARAKKTTSYADYMYVLIMIVCKDRITSVIIKLSFVQVI